MIPVLILAAGASSRMRGRDKLLETVDGVPLLSRQVAAAQTVSPHVFVTLPSPPHRRYDLIGSATPVPVPDAKNGLSASLRTGIQSLPSDATAALILLADLPELTADDLQTVLDAHIANPTATVVRATSVGGKMGHPILFDASTFPSFAHLDGDTGAQSIIAANKKSLHLVKLPDNRATTDLDTPEEWLAWRQQTGR